MPRWASSCPSRLKGTPLPYLSCATIAVAVSSYFSGPTPSGSWAVNTCPQAPQRNRSSEYRGRQGCLSYDPHQHLRFFLAVDIALPAIRAAISMLQFLVVDLDLLRATECLSPVAPVSLGRRCRTL